MPIKLNNVLLCPSGLSGQVAVEETIQYMLDRVGGRGGAIVVTPDREVGVAFNCDKMPWAIVKDGLIKYGVVSGEETTLDFNTKVTDEF